MSWLAWSVQQRMHARYSSLLRLPALQQELYNVHMFTYFYNYTYVVIALMHWNQLVGDSSRHACQEATYSITVANVWGCLPTQDGR